MSHVKYGEYMIGIWASDNGAVCHIVNKHNLVDRVISVVPDPDMERTFWIYIKGNDSILGQLRSENVESRYSLIIPDNTQESGG